jgi:anion-transporting  ArsA/GET3 family ATPase
MAPVLDTLLRRRLVFVTGKGGVGKSTVATALGVLAARRGLRTMVAELAGQERLQRAFSRAGDRFTEVELAPNLHTISVDPERAKEEYLRVKVGRLGRVLNASRVFNALALATPGMLDLLSMGKVWELAQLERRTPGASPYDFVIVDAPATGHGVGLLRTPGTFAEIAKVGPIANQGSRIAATLADPDFTAVIAVSTPEEMAVAETVAISNALAQQGLALHLAILNALYPARFDEEEIGALTGALGTAPYGPSRSAVAAAVSEHARAGVQRRLAQRLCEQLAAPVLTVPYLFVERIGPEELERIADELEQAVSD